METYPHQQIRRAVVVGQVVQEALGFAQEGVGASQATLGLAPSHAWAALRRRLAALRWRSDLTICSMRWR